MQAESSTHDMPRGDGSRLLADFDDELNCEAENQEKPACDEAPRMLTPDHCRGLTTKKYVPLRPASRSGRGRRGDRDRDIEANSADSIQDERYTSPDFFRLRAHLPRSTSICFPRRHEPQRLSVELPPPPEDQQLRFRGLQSSRGSMLGSTLTAPNHANLAPPF
jgi:hypothetical protein